MPVVDRPIRPLPTRRARSAPPSTSEQYTGLCQDPPLPFSVAHKFPWEVLLAICKQADEATLVQLCLVSFGMLELAGPILYRHVHIVTAERLHSYLIKPSIIPAASRLRSIIGLGQLRFLRVDFRPFEEERTAILFPGSVWSSSETRLALLSHVRLAWFENKLGPFASTAISTRLHKLLAHVARQLICVIQISTLDHGTLDFMVFLSSSPSSAGKSATCIRNIDPLLACRHLPTVLKALSPSASPRKVTLDLRRVVLDPPPSATYIYLRGTAISVITAPNLRRTAASIDFEFLVASDQIAKMIEDVIVSLAGRHRCRVVRA